MRATAADLLEAISANFGDIRQVLGSLPEFVHPVTQSSLGFLRMSTVEGIHSVPLLGHYVSE